ncbi:pyridoxal 5'-phosphate synthase glutaminase subunit PdxT [Ornithinimicrobium sediminis]|uniref:pyridoxal 5'-phosphate synthase glutaminase subunit PdxT n=1 Tax=Ornithinimicrobium sediminis TaxID=2904603 RepID=UPI001E5627E6|nr:pyridoxal 5'-phosphate synthase glutaminase subunit PdxT [Ornithinimicrobium sediminis]
MVTPRVGVLAVQGDVREHLRALTLAGAEALPVRRAEEVERVDALVLPGGESTTIDRLTRVFGLREPLRRRIAQGMPVYGSCAGMIMLADRVLDGHPDQQTLGGLDITVRRNAFGRQVDSFECDLDVTGLPQEGGPYRAVFIRAPWVEQVGPGVEVLATVAFHGADHVVAVRQGNLVATSFHPEVTDDHRVHAFFVDLVRQAGSIGSRPEETPQAVPVPGRHDDGEGQR